MYICIYIYIYIYMCVFEINEKYIQAYQILICILKKNIMYPSFFYFNFGHQCVKRNKRYVEFLISLHLSLEIII